MTSRIHVRSGRCPVLGRITYSLWDGEVPIVAASIWLRHLTESGQVEDDGEGSNTIATYATALVSFFRYLESPPSDDDGNARGRLEFFDLTVEDIEAYKRDWLLNPERALKRTTAQLYLSAVKQVIRYWRGRRDRDPGVAPVSWTVNGLDFMQLQTAFRASSRS